MQKLTHSFMAFVIILTAAPYTVAAMPDLPLAGKVVILDPGHGQGNTNTYAGYDEQAAMLKLAHKIKPVLESYGATIHMTRLTQEDIPLPVRTAMINRWALEAVSNARLEEIKALVSQHAPQNEIHRLSDDILEINRLLEILQGLVDDYKTSAPIYLNFPFDYSYTRQIHPDLQKVFEYQDDPVVYEDFLVISLHSNATPRPINTLLNGADIFYISNTLENNMNYYAYYSNEFRSLFLATKLLDNIDAVGIHKGKADGHYFHIIREHNLPAVLVENGYHTNFDDRGKLSDDEFLEQLAQAYADAILSYWNESHAYILENNPAYISCSGSVSVIYNGSPILFSNPSIERYGFTFYPLEDVLNALSGGHEWHPESNIVSGSLNYNWIAVSLNNLNYISNGRILKTPEELKPFIENNRTYVYLDYVAEALGFSTHWNDTSRTIIISENP